MCVCVPSCPQGPDCQLTDVVADVGGSVGEDPVNQLTHHLPVDQRMYLRPERGGEGGEGGGGEFNAATAMVGGAHLEGFLQDFCSQEAGPVLRSG